MITLKEIKDNISSKIIIPKEFDDFYKWSFSQSEKNKEMNFPYCFEWDNNLDLLEELFKSGCSDRFGVFGSGSDGSIYTFWIDDQGNQKIVYLGSHWDEFLVLGNTFIEFLQYLSIGYADPDIDDFKLTFEQISKRDKVDYDDMSVESINEYDETYGKPLQTEEGIKELFGQDIDDETLKMFLEINKNAVLNSPKIDVETVEKAKKEMKEREIITNQQRIDFRQWLVEAYKIKLPIKGTEILNLNDKSFENWAYKNIKNEN